MGTAACKSDAAVTNNEIVQAGHNGDTAKYGFPIYLDKMPPHEGIMTSRVVDKPDTWWKNCGIIDAHEGLRVYFSILPKLFMGPNALFKRDQYEKIQSWHVQCFCDWYIEFLYTSLHHHHRAEEEYYYPWVSDRVAAPPGLTDDHITMVDFLENLKHLCHQKDNWSRNYHEQLCDKMTGLLDLMDKHLDEEEEYVVNALKVSGFTPEEEFACRGRILKDFGFDGGKTFAPTICYAMCRYDGHAQYKRFVDIVLPPESAMLLETFWLPNFRHNSLGVLKALIDNRYPFQKKEGLVTQHLYHIPEWDVHYYEEHPPDEKIVEASKHAEIKTHFERDKKGHVKLRFGVTYKKHGDEESFVAPPSSVKSGHPKMKRELSMAAGLGKK